MCKKPLRATVKLWCHGRAALGLQIGRTGGRAMKETPAGPP